MRARLVLIPIAMAIISTTSTARASTPPNQGFMFPVFGTVPCGYEACPESFVPDHLGSDLCTNPIPSLSIVEVVTDPAPTPPDGKKMILDLKIHPKVDWDATVCPEPGFVTHADYIGAQCDGTLGPDNPLPFGCQEDVQSPATAGHRYRMLGINRADAFDCPAIYSWIFV